MKTSIVAAALVLLIGSALADETSAPPEETTAADLVALANAIRSQRNISSTAADDAQAQVVMLRARAARLNEYLKKCGDKPGCTQPVADPPPGMPGEERPAPEPPERE